MEEKPKPLKASRSATEAGHSASASASTLDMKPCDSKLWLMKVPNFLLEHWMTRNEPTEVGTVKETVGSDGKKSMTLQLSEQGDYPKEWPREYDFGVDAPLTSMHVFSTGAKGTMQMDGRVEKRGEVKPQGLSTQYRAIMKNRVERDQVRHGVQTYQEDAHDRGMVPLTTRDKQKHAKKEQRVQGRQEKRADKQSREKPLEAVREGVFEQFQAQRFWNKRELETKLDQQGLPVVKQVLR
jgi:hypothetical protein